MKKSSDSLSTTAPPPPPTSFTSLPYDVFLNCLARISRIHRPTLYLVSKSFGSLMASRELHAIRSLIGKTEDCLYVCLDLHRRKPNPRWFTLAPIPQRQKLLPITDSFLYQHPESSTIVSMGSNMYLIGGLVDGKRSSRVLVLDCRSHRWRSLPDMIVPRERPATEVIDGKIYVIGGCDDEHDNIEYSGEVYDPKTQTWKPLSPTTLNHLFTQKTVAPGKLVMGGKVYAKEGLKLNLKTSCSSSEFKYRYFCLVEIETNVWCEITISGLKLVWHDINDVSDYESWSWRSVIGLENLLPKSLFRPYLVSVTNSGGRKVMIWWKTMKIFTEGRSLFKGSRIGIISKTKTKIWCAEISFQRQSAKELKGFIKWSKSVFTFDEGSCGSDFFLNYAIVKQ